MMEGLAASSFLRHCRPPRRTKAKKTPQPEPDLSQSTLSSPGQV